MKPEEIPPKPSRHGRAPRNTNELMHDITGAGGDDQVIETNEIRRKINDIQRMANLRIGDSAINREMNNELNKVKTTLNRLLNDQEMN